MPYCAKDLTASTAIPPAINASKPRIQRGINPKNVSKITTTPQIEINARKENIPAFIITAVVKTTTITSIQRPNNSLDKTLNKPNCSQSPSTVSAKSAVPVDEVSVAVVLNGVSVSGIKSFGMVDVVGSVPTYKR